MWDTFISYLDSGACGTLYLCYIEPLHFSVSTGLAAKSISCTQDSPQFSCSTSIPTLKASRKSSGKGTNYILPSLIFNFLILEISFSLVTHLSPSNIYIERRRGPIYKSSLFQTVLILYFNMDKVN